MEVQCLSRFNNSAAQGKGTPVLYLASHARGLAQWMQLLDLAEKVAKKVLVASPKNGFLAHFIR